MENKSKENFIAWGLRRVRMFFYYKICRAKKHGFAPLGHRRFMIEIMDALFWGGANIGFVATQPPSKTTTDKAVILRKSEDIFCLGLGTKGLPFSPFKNPSAFGKIE